MTLRIGDNLSLLDPQVKLQRESENLPRGTGAAGRFSEKLESILEAAGSSPRTGAASLAEAFNLQMLRTTLTLSGDEPSADQPLPQLFSRTPALHALIKAYLPETSEQPGPDTALSVEREIPVPEATQPERPSTVPTSATGERWLDPIIARASRHYGVEVGLIKAVIKAESNFNPTAVSHAGARGLMQLMPATARSLGVSDSFDPEQNVMAGTRFLRDLLKRYNGDLDSALAAYNWGPGNVDRRPDRLPRETREYLSRVKQLYTTYSG